MPVKMIDVNQECLDNGKPGEARKCPAYLAIKPFIKDEIDLTILPVNASFELYHGVLVIKSTIVSFPEDVRSKIYAIDDGQTVEPFSFNLDIPEWAVKA